MESEITNSAAAFGLEVVGHYDPSHDGQHLFRVSHLCRRILSSPQFVGRTDIDRQLVEMAAFLHDITDKKYATDERPPALVWGELFKKLEPLGFTDAERKRKLQEIVERVSYRHQLEEESLPNCPARFPELDIVQDADRLDAMGAIGIARCIAFGSVRGRAIYDEHTQTYAEWLKMGGPEVQIETYKKLGATNHTDGTSVGHFYDKLLHLKNRMNTQEGKKLAIERHHFMVRFLQTLEREIIAASPTPRKCPLGRTGKMWVSVACLSAAAIGWVYYRS